MLNVDIKKQLSHFQLAVQFQIDDEIVVLFGPSGSGKTTVLNLISGLDQPNQGLIRLNNRTFFHEQQKPLPVQKRKVGYLFQDYALFPHLTVEGNILYGTKKGTTIDSPFIQQLLQVMGIKHLLKRSPNQISGGEKQRVALARAFAIEPDILLLDEPFSALDDETKIECHNELERLHQLWKIPIILVTHDMEEAKKLGDRILYLKNGQIIEAESSLSNGKRVKLKVI